MQLQIAQDLIDTAQVGVTEPFPTQHTVEEVRNWISRNEDEIHWLSKEVLEDLITEQAGNGTLH